MLNKKEFEKEMAMIIGHIFCSNECELLNSKETKKDDKILTTYDYLYYDFNYNCIVYYQEHAVGIVDSFGDMYEEETTGYEIINHYTFK